MAISVALVILVVFVFLRNLRATLIPSGGGPGLAGLHVRRLCISSITASTTCR
jgi:hypothetical protein